jgi:hypothetical protein
MGVKEVQSRPQILSTIPYGGSCDPPQDGGSELMQGLEPLGPPVCDDVSFIHNDNGPIKGGVVEELL